MEKTFSAKEQKELNKRERILNDNLWKVIFSIAIPLVLYNLCNYLYGIFDTMIVSKSNIGNVDSVTFLDQIKQMIVPLGATIATGGGILVARKFGAGKIEDAKRTANTSFWLCFLLAIGVSLVIIPFAAPFLKVFKTPQSFIDQSLGYFDVQILSVSVSFINNIFISLEKAKGNTKRILILNLIVVAIKIGLTIFFVYGVEGATVTWVASATLIAQSVMMLFGLVILFNKGNILGISIKNFNLRKSELLPILSISIPIFLGRFLFSYGKVFINTEALIYGEAAVGALAISNSIAGSTTNILNSFEDASSTITSQNLGNKNIGRTFETFRKMIIIGISIGIIGTLTLTLFGEQIAKFFAPGNLEKQEMIRKINFYENLALVFLGLECASFGLLYGYGKTRLTMFTAIARLFLFRIPPLLLMIHFCSPGFYISTGIAMGISNACSGLLAFSLAMFIIKDIKRKGMYQDILYSIT